MPLSTRPQAGAGQRMLVRDYLNFVGIAILSGLTILCYLVILPILIRKKDNAYVVIAVVGSWCFRSQRAAFSRPAGTNLSRSLCAVYQGRLPGRLLLCSSVEADAEAEGLESKHRRGKARSIFIEVRCVSSYRRCAAEARSLREKESGGGRIPCAPKISTI